MVVLCNRRRPKAAATEHEIRRGEHTGGIIIPDTAKEKPSQGEVIAVGPGGRDESGKLIPIDVKEGSGREDSNLCQVTDVLRSDSDNSTRKRAIAG